MFGCDPCPQPKHPAQDTSTFAAGIAPFLDPAFLAGYSSPSESGNYVVEDEETAAVDAVAHARHVPFLGIRGVSDGGGDPLHLPGFPAEFFAYRQLAGDNAARVTLRLLRRR